MSNNHVSTNLVRIVILGGGYAGVMAALRLANRTRGESVKITLVNGRDAFVERTRLHEATVGNHPPAPSLSAMLGEAGVHFVQGWVKGLDLARRTVQIDAIQADGASHPQALAYDKLIYALGSFTALSGLPGAAEYALPVERHDAIASRLAQLPSGARVLVIGAGLTGLEVATEIAERYPHLAVAMVTGSKVGQDLAPAGQRYLRNALRKLGVEVHEQTRLARLEDGMAIATNGATLPFDLSIMSAGFAVSKLAQEVGLAVNGRGQVLVDPYLRSVSHPAIYAAGDAATMEEGCPVTLRMACATALPMAAHAAENVARTVRGMAEEPFRFGYFVRCISLGRRAALVQFVDAADRPRRWVLTGRVGMWVKENILRWVMSSLHGEKRRATYMWPRLQSAAAPLRETQTGGLQQAQG